MPYNTSMRFEVPQFIEIEDKIFGPFTWKQFVYLAGGVGFGVVVLLFATPLIVFILFGVPVGCMGLLLAFYPVNNRPFSTFLESMLTFYNNAKVYHWHKKANVVYSARSSSPVQKNPYPIPSKDVRSIRALSRTLEISSIQKK